MKNHPVLLPFCTLFLLVICPGLHADSPLEAKMNQMRKSFRELKKSMLAAVEADKQKYLSWVSDVKSAAEASQALEPEETSHIPEDQKTVILYGRDSCANLRVGSFQIHQRASI